MTRQEFKARALKLVASSARKDLMYSSSDKPAKGCLLQQVFGVNPGSRLPDGQNIYGAFQRLFETVHGESFDLVVLNSQFVSSLSPQAVQDTRAALMKYLRLLPD